MYKQYNQIDELKRMNEKHSLAYELLVEVKASARRWFIISIVELIIILGMTAGIIWYVSLPVEEYSIDQKADDSSYNQVIGGDYNGE